MNRPHVPQAVIDLAHLRRTARGAGEWDRADVLRAEIEAAGWRVVDSGTDFALHPLRAPDAIRDGVLVHGSSTSVPSRLDEASTAAATVVAIDEARFSDRLASAAGIQVVSVETVDLHGEVAPRSASVASETIRIDATIGPGAIRNAGARRAVGAIVVIAAAPLSLDLLRKCVDVLADPAIAIVGSTGVRTLDLRRYELLEPGGDDAPTAVTGPVVAFRRSDLEARGPFDEGFRSSTWLDIWWSLVLRDEAGHPPRRAVELAAFGRAPATAVAAAGSLEDSLRQSRRDRYRLAERFAGRTDLIPGSADQPATRP